MNEKKPVLTDSKARKIIETDFSRSMAVNAGAGSGKTHEMVLRIINGVKADLISMENIAVITFTRKAASEMRTRIIEGLNKLVTEEKNKLRRNKYEEQLIKAVTAQISTIHSFCAGILKEKPVEAGIDPSFEMIEGDNSGFFDEVFDEYIHTVFIEKKDSVMHAAIETLIMDYGFDLKTSDYGYNKKPSIQDLLKTFAEHRDSALAMPEKIDIKKSRKQIESFLSGCISDTEDAPTLQAKYIAIEQNFKSAADDIDSLYDFKFSLSTCGGPGWQDYRNESKEAFPILLNKYIYSLRYTEQKDIYDKLIILFKDFITYYRVREIKDGMLDNEDLLIYTRDILRDKPEIREYFKERYTHLFVDEFQDTDPVQTEIVFFLSEAPGTYSKTWQDVQIKDGKLFIIGDMKQAIYNFRRADVTSFIKAMDKIGEDNTVSLTSNFRSDKNILEFVNSHFQHTMNGADAYSPLFEPLDAAKPDNTGSTEKRIIAVTPPQAGIKYKAEELRELQSDTAVRWIKDNKGIRFDKWSEVTILIRGGSDTLPALQDSFEAKGVPCEVAGSKSYFGRYEVQALATLLRAVADPSDKISIYGALKGPFFGHSDRDLRTYFPEGKISLFVNDSESTIGKSCTLLASLHNDSLKLRADEIITRIFNETGILRGLAAGYMGREKVYNLIKAKEFIRRNGDGVLLDALDKLTGAIDSGIEMADLTPASGESDVVQIMTIHRAKGLENRVIYIADAAYQKQSRNTTLAHNGSIYLKHNDLKLFQYDGIKLENDLKESEEEERLRYVAATRACEYLVFNHFEIERSRRNNEDSFIYSFYESLENSNLVHSEEVTSNSGDDVYQSNNSYPDINPKINSTISKQQNEWSNELKSLKEKGAESVFKTIKPSSFRSASEDTVQLEISYSPEDMKLNIVQHKGEAPTIGTIIHRLLESGTKLNESGLKKLTEGLLKQEDLKIDSESVLSIYNRITANDTYIRSLKSKKAYRELPVLFNHNGALVNGIIDLLFEDESGWVLADYKILLNPVTADEKGLENKYKGQLDLYEIGLQKLGITINEKLLIV